MTEVAGARPGSDRPGSDRPGSDRPAGAPAGGAPAGAGAPAAGAAAAVPAGEAPGADRRFEAPLAELEAGTDRLAHGQIGIDEAAELYEHATALHRLAAERLDAVRARVERLRDSEVPAGGSPA